MRVLFIARKKKKNFSNIVLAQAESLKKQGICLEFFGIEAGGFRGYLKAIFQLYFYSRNNKFDIYHAHYSLSGIVAAMTGVRPLVVSLMGSDTQQNPFFSWVAKFCSKYLWNANIVKSNKMGSNLNNKNKFIVPNGVDLDSFKPMDNSVAKEKVGFEKSNKNILFLANPERPEKNYKLANDSFEMLNSDGCKLHTVFNISHKEVVEYLNAADVVILTSKFEGSPNVVKEAMACNRPLVSTDVGDVKWLLGKEAGYFISDFKPEDFSIKIKEAIAFSEVQKHTKGRNRLRELKLDSKSVANQIIKIYKSAQK